MEKCGADFSKLAELSEKKAELEAQLDAKTERWIYLNDKAERIGNSAG